MRISLTSVIQEIMPLCNLACAQPSPAMAGFKGEARPQEGYFEVAIRGQYVRNDRIKSIGKMFYTDRFFLYTFARSKINTTTRNIISVLIRIVSDIIKCASLLIFFECQHNLRLC